MPMFLRKKETSRQVFGFLYDRALALRIKVLAGVLKVPIYTLCEHLLQLGLAHIGAEIGINLEGMEPVTQELQEHLLNKHLLVKKLRGEAYEQMLVAKHGGLTLEQEEQVIAFIDLVKKLDDEGVPRDLVMKEVEELPARVERRHNVHLADRLLRGYRWEAVENK